MIPSNPLLQIFIVRNHLPYEELNTLSSDLRTILGQNNVVITKANYRMLSELIDSIKAEENNLIILLTQDIELDGNLQQQLNEMKQKNIRLILYPQELSKDNNYLLTKTKQDILNAAVMYFKIVQGKSQMKILNSLPQQQSNVRSSHMRVSASQSPHQPIIASSFKPLSQLANQSYSPIGLFALRSKDKQFNSLMNLLFIKHKNNPLINFQQIMSFQSLQASKNQKQILVISEKQANQIQNLTPYLGNLNSKVFAIRFLDKRGVRKPNTNFHFQTNKIQDIQYLVDTSLAKLQNNPNTLNQRTNYHNTNPNTYTNTYTNVMQSGFNNKSSIYDRSNSTNTRISMKSAKKINNIFANQQNSQLFIYDKNQSSEFKQFYRSLPFSYQITTNISQLQPSFNPIILAPSQACPLVFSQIPNNTKLLLYANTLTPQILINHPLVTMATSNINQLIAFLKIQNILVKSYNPGIPYIPSQTVPITTSIPSPSTSQLKYISNNDKLSHAASISTQNNTIANLQWTVKYDGRNYQTFLDTSPSRQSSNLIRIQPSQLSNELRQAKNIRNSHMLELEQIEYQIVDEIKETPYVVNSEYIASQVGGNILNNSNYISPERIEQFVIKSTRKSVINNSSSINTNNTSIPSMPTFKDSNNQNQNIEWFVQNNNNQYQLNKQNINSINIPINPHSQKQIHHRKHSIPQIIITPPFSDKEVNKKNSQIQYLPPISQYTPTQQPISTKIINNTPIPSHQTIQTHITQTVNKPLPINNTITFNQYSSEKDRKTQSINYDGPILSPYQTMRDIDCSLVSIPQRIYTEKAISCRILDTPNKDIERNLLGLASSANQIKNIPKITETLEYQAHPIEVYSSPNNVETQIVYSNQQTIFINKHIAKKQQHQKLCSGVFQVRTEGEAHININPSLSSSTFIQNISAKSQQIPLVERIIIDSPKTASIPLQIPNPITLPTQTTVSNHIPITVTPPQIQNNRRSSIMQISPYTPPQSRQSQSLQPPHRNSYRFSNISQVPSIRLSHQIPQPLPYIDLNPKRDSRNSLQLNQINFDVRTQNGVKVYKRKSQSVDNNFISSSMLRQIQPSNTINLRADHYYNKQSKPSMIKEQRHSSYYNNQNYTPINTHRLSSIKTSIPAPRESKLVVPSISNQNNNGRFYRTSRVSGFADNTSHRASNISNITNVQQLPLPSSSTTPLDTMSNSSLFSAVHILIYRGEQELQNSLKVRLKNKISLYTYYNLQSLMHQTVKLKNQNLVVVLNEELRLLDQEIEQIHPNVSIITYTKSVSDGTHVANSVPEVLSMIQKWYFKY